jgi:hypothetical protein
MAAVLDTYGLGDLSDFVYNEIIAKETVNINNPDAIIFAIREQPAYKKRFAGNAARLKAGLSELDPASYIALENQFRQTLQSNGLPANFYDQAEDFQAFIEGDVSPSELNERVQQGYRAVADADPAVKEQMRTCMVWTKGSWPHTSLTLSAQPHYSAVKHKQPISLHEALSRVVSSCQDSLLRTWLDEELASNRLAQVSLKSVL